MARRDRVCPKGGCASLSRAKECGRKGGDEEDDVTTRREGRDGWKSSSWREERGGEIAGEEGLWMGEMGSGSGSGSEREWMDMDGEVEVEVYVGGTRATYSLRYLPTSPTLPLPTWLAQHWIQWITAGTTG